LRTVASNAFEIERAVLDADMVIGAALIPGAKAPTLVTNELASRMKPGSVLVDSSTHALTNVTLPYAVALANKARGLHALPACTAREPKSIL
jgi:alanine dehydrogenase